MKPVLREISAAVQFAAFAATYCFLVPRGGLEEVLSHRTGNWFQGHVVWLLEVGGQQTRLVDVVTV